MRRLDEPKDGYTEVRQEHGPGIHGRGTRCDEGAGPRAQGGSAPMWLLTIADAHWRPSQGTHVATIGPLPVARGVAYTAQYYGSGASAGDEIPGPPAFRSGSLVHARRRDVSRN